MAFYSLPQDQRRVGVSYSLREWLAKSTAPQTTGFEYPAGVASVSHNRWNHMAHTSCVFLGIGCVGVSALSRRPLKHCVLKGGKQLTYPEGSGVYPALSHPSTHSHFMTIQWGCNYYSQARNEETEPLRGACPKLSPIGGQTVTWTLLFLLIGRGKSVHWAPLTVRPWSVVTLTHKGSWGLPKWDDLLRCPAGECGSPWHRQTAVAWQEDTSLMSLEAGCVSYRTRAVRVLRFSFPSCLLLDRVLSEDS